MKTINDSNSVIFNANRIPLVSWGFSASFQSEIKNRRLDLCKIDAILSQNKCSNVDWDFKVKLQEKVILITDTRLNIVFASHSMYKMNGYSEKEVLGKSPKLFQGEATIKQTSLEIREAIENKIPFSKQVLNYKKNGSLYYCNIDGFPIFNKKGDLVHFIAFEEAA
jgi:PAS domain S-box-containing protein